MQEAQGVGGGRGGGGAVDPDALYAAALLQPDVGGPAAGGEDVGVGDLAGGGLGVDEGEVGVVAFADVASAVYAVDVGGGVAVGAFCHFGAHHVDEQGKRELYAGGAAGGGEGASLLVCHEMRGVVGGKHVDLAGEEGHAQGHALRGALDRGVHLDAGAQAGVVGGGEEQVVHGHLRGNELLGYGGVAELEEVELGGCGDMADVEAAAVRAGELHG